MENTSLITQSINEFGEKILNPYQRGYAITSFETIISNEAQQILKVLHAEDYNSFIMAIESLLTAEEFETIKAAEKNLLFIQAAKIFDRAIRRLTLKFAELIGFSKSALADVIEPRTQIKADLSCVVLNIHSRNLKGPVAFKVSEITTKMDCFPEAALHLLAETKEFWKRQVYLEPMYDREGNILKSIRQVKNVYAKPKDPLISTFVGIGPKGYGYSGLPRNFLNRHSKIRASDEKTRDVVFLICHWD